LKVKNLQVGHIDEDFIEDGWIINLTVLKITSGDRWAGKKTTKIIDTVPSHSVASKVEHVKVHTVFQPLDLCNQVVGQIKVG